MKCGGGKIWTNMQFFVSVGAIGSAAFLAEHQESVQCRRIQMSDEVTSLSGCRNPAVVSRKALRYLLIDIIYSVQMQPALI